MRNYIELNNNLIDVFFGNMDADCLAEIQKMEQEGNLLLNVKTGELVQDGVGQSIYTDYFNDGWCFTQKAYCTSGESVIIAKQQNGDAVKIELSPLGSDGWDSAICYDEKQGTTHGKEFKVYQLAVENYDGEYKYFNVWFEDKEKAMLFFD